MEPDRDVNRDEVRALHTTIQAPLLEILAGQGDEWKDVVRRCTTHMIQQMQHGPNIAGVYLHHMSTSPDIAVEQVIPNLLRRASIATQLQQAGGARSAYTGRFLPLYKDAPRSRWYVGGGIDTSAPGINGEGAVLLGVDYLTVCLEDNCTTIYASRPQLVSDVIDGLQETPGYNLNSSVTLQPMVNRIVVRGSAPDIRQETTVVIVRPLRMGDAPESETALIGKVFIDKVVEGTGTVIQVHPFQYYCQEGKMCNLCFCGGPDQPWIPLHN